MRARRLKALLCALILISAVSVAPCASASAPRGQRPRLLVVISVDQMRGDVTTRYAGYLSHGLRRLVDGGLSFSEAHHDHAITVTAAGHATLSTGCTPAHTGIVGNDWFDRTAGKDAYCTADSSVGVVGARTADADGQSPRNLRRPALGDWLKAASPASRVFSIAGKDRSAVLMGGLHPDGAFWYSDKFGRYVTSTRYSTALPAWLEAFNEEGRVQAAFKAGWHRSLPEYEYLVSNEDAFPTENDCESTTFPHTLDTSSAVAALAFQKGVMQTPFGDEMTLDLAEKLIVEERLGMDRAPDVLWVGLSAADLIGHAYGPLSQETQDYYVRLDRRLGGFLDFLDRRIGVANYVVALSSDHGVMPLPEDLARRGYPASRIVTKDFTSALSAATEDARVELGLTRPLFRSSNYMGVYLDLSEATSRGLTLADVRARVATKVRGVPFIADAMTSDELSASSTPTDRAFLDVYRRSFTPDRSPDVMIRPKEYSLVSWRTCGTSHGTPYRFDTHVPMIFFGAGVTRGHRSERVRTIDLAPTLAGILGIAPPAGVDGTALFGPASGRK